MNQHSRNEANLANETALGPSGMSVALSFPPGVFTRLEPLGDSAPVVIDVSRSGQRYPVDFRPVAPFNAVHNKTSMYVDELLAYAPEVGATLVCAEFPVTVIDTNRSRDDIDPALYEGELPFEPKPTDRSLKNGAGLIHSVGTGKIPLYEQKLSASEIVERIERYYDPYHAELRRVLEETKSEHGKVYQLSFHCMSSIDPKKPDAPDARRPDVCLCDIDGTTCGVEFRELVAEKFAALGYEVTVNAPFKGGQLISRHGAPETGVHSLQVELCKRLFMDESNGKRSKDFGRLQHEIRDVISGVCEFAGQKR